MFCSHCGKDLIEGAAFCTQCGTPSVGFTPTKTGGEGKAVASLWCGIISWLTLGILFPLSIVGFFLGILGLNSRRPGLATAGICLNATALGLLLLVGPMIALLLPAIQASREVAKRMMCSNNEKQIGIALHSYHNEHGALPPLYTVDEEGKPLHSWRVLILPYIEQQELYRQIRKDEPWDSEHNRQFHTADIMIYRCPSVPRNNPAGTPTKTCTYSAVGGLSFIPAKEPGSVLGLKFGDFINGIRDTAAIVEVKEPFCWMDPTADISLNDPDSVDKVGSNHSEAVNVLCLDASIRVYALNEIRNYLRRLSAAMSPNDPAALQFEPPPMDSV